MKKQTPCKKRAILTKEIEAQILERISSGESARAACKVYNIALTTFLDNVCAEQYARARDENASFYFDKLSEIAKDVLDGDTDPQRGRVAADILKWTVAKMSPKNYGDRVALTGDANSDPIKHSHTVAVSKEIQDFIALLQNSKE